MVCLLCHPWCHVKLTISHRQSTLDGILIQRAPEFTDAGYLDHVIELVVVENKVHITFFAVDLHSFNML
jgi:hypothetical protein